MTTATDWDDATWTDTGSHAVVTDVQIMIDGLDGAATEAPVQIEPWVAKTPDHIHDDLCRKVQPGEYADEPTPNAGPAPDTADLTKRIDLTMASYRLMRHQEVKAELWHAEASHMWAEQGVTSRISERYTDRREALLSAYEAECERLKARVLTGRPLDQAPGLAGPVYGGHVYTEERGYVEAEPPPADRSGLDKLRDRVPTALTTGETATQVGASSGTSNETPPRVGGWRVWAASAAIGIVGLAATIGALVVLA